MKPLGDALIADTVMLPIVGDVDVDSIMQTTVGTPFIEDEKLMGKSLYEFAGTAPSDPVPCLICGVFLNIFVNNFLMSNILPPFYTITSLCQPNAVIDAYKSPSVVPLCAVVSNARQTSPNQSTVSALERASFAVPLPTIKAYSP